MKLTQVTLGQVILLTGPESREGQGKGRALFDFVRGIESRYKFLQGPRVIDDYNFNKGMKFYTGTLGGEWWIDRFEIYNNGILCEGKVSTDRLEEFAEDVTNWSDGEFGVPPPGGPRAFLSNVEVECELDLAQKLKQFDGIGNQITQMLRSYGQSPFDFRASQIVLHADMTNVTPPKATPFSFDRRAERPYADNIYFCSAPLRTPDQMKVLDTLEEIFRP